MSNKVIIAAAGSGKTQHLVKEAIGRASGNVLIKHSQIKTQRR